MRALARFLLRIFGWRTVGEPPACERYVMTAAPHTANVDTLLFILFAFAFGLRLSWLGSHTLFRFGFTPLMRALGGIPVYPDGEEKGSLVEQMGREFARRERLILALAPEGSRFRTEYWRSGFYRIARHAGVPIVASYLDFGTKTAGFGPPVQPSHSPRADMDRIRAVYAGKRGLFPDRFGPVRLSDEEA